MASGVAIRTTPRTHAEAHRSGVALLAVILVAAAIIGSAAGLAFTAWRQPDTKQATALLIVARPGSAGYTDPVSAQRLLQTSAGVAASRAVRDATLADAGLARGTATPSLGAQVVRDTELLTLSVGARSAADAGRVLTAYTGALTRELRAAYGSDLKVVLVSRDVTDLSGRRWTNAVVGAAAAALVALAMLLLLRRPRPRRR